MDNLVDLSITPAIIIALISVIIQGIKILIDLIIQIINKKNTNKQNNLIYLTILNEFIDSSPLDDGEKISLKIDILKQYSRDEIPEKIHDLFE